MPVVCPRSGEGAGLGAAVQAGWTSGGSRDLAAICARLVGLDVPTRVEPDAKNTERHADLLAKTARLRDTLHINNLL